MLLNGANVVTDELRKAFDEASKLPESEQDSLAQWLLRELDSERRWTEAFSDSADALAELADEAIQDHKNGRTEELEPNSL